MSARASVPKPSTDPRIARTRKDVLGAAMQLLVDEGWEAVTQPNVARVAGYSKSTVYGHWPERMDLLRETFARFEEVPHHEPTGDVRTDLIGELTCFRAAFVEHHLDRVLAVLAERALTVPAVVDIRKAFVEEGERPIRKTLKAIASGPDLEAATLMLCGMVLDGVLLHGRPPTDKVIAASVDQVLRGLGHATR